MPWVKLTDDWYDDDSIVAAGPHATLLWVTGLSWCARNLTDGAIPARQIRKLIDAQGIVVDGEPLRADEVASQLVETGLWDQVDGGFQVRNYLKYQPSREQVLASRAKDRERKSSRPGAGRKSSQPRDPDPEDPGQDVPDGFPPESPPIPERPVPVPVPDGFVGNTSSRNSRGTAPPVDDEKLSTGPGQDLPPVPGEVWDYFAEIRFARQDPSKIDSHSGWKRKTRENAVTEHDAQARRWWHTYEISTRRLAECLSDGKHPTPAVLRRRAS